MIHVYGVACSQEENGQVQKDESESLKPKIDALRKNFDMVSVSCKTFVIHLPNVIYHI